MPLHSSLSNKSKTPSQFFYFFKGKKTRKVPEDGQRKEKSQRESSEEGGVARERNPGLGTSMDSKAWGGRIVHWARREAVKSR